MPSVYLLALVYIIGGLTFIPLVFVLVVCHAYLTLPFRSHSTNDTFGDEREITETLEKSSRHVKTTAQSIDDHSPNTSTPEPASGYFAVCREYVPGGVNGKPPERTTPAGAVVVVESPSVYQTMYRSLFDRNKNASPSIDAAPTRGLKGRNTFYVVLRYEQLCMGTVVA